MVVRCVYRCVRPGPLRPSELTGPHLSVAGLALWLICIIERAEINNPANNTTFNIFNIMFELISGYGTVGLSLGVANVRCRHSPLSALPTRCPSDTHPSLQDNYSLSGGFKTLSKLVVIAVMIRGRHRGLPVAIDRAVMLPKELLEVDADLEEETRARQSRRSRCVGKAACHPCPCV